MAVAETSLVKKNHQIATVIHQKIAQLLIEKQSMTDISQRLSVSTSNYCIWSAVHQKAEVTNFAYPDGKEATIK